jgi:tetratricopeptide (TPR) repeat protein
MMFAAAAGACLVTAQTPAPGAEQVIEMLRVGEYQQALNAADHLLTQTPHDCRILSLRGIALKSLNRGDEAAESFRQALHYCPNDMLALEGAAEVEYARRQPDAEELLKRILAIRPTDETANAMLATYYQMHHACQSALPHFEAGRVLLASHPKMVQGYAYCLAETNHYQQAADAYRSILAAAPNPAARYDLALMQWKLHDTKGALDTLQPLLAGDVDEPVLAFGSRLAEETGDTPHAVGWLRQAILKAPRDVENYLEFAQIAFNHHSFQVGIDMLNVGLKQSPNAAPLYVARGVLEVQLSEADKAMADFKRAHDLAPQLSLAMDAIGIVESQKYNPAAAQELFRRQAQLHPNDSLLEYLYAEALADSDSTPESAQKAIDAAERSVSLDPRYAPARDLLSLLWLRVNQPTRALQEAEAALKIQPNDDAALYQEIMARRRLGQRQGMQKLVQQLVAMRSQNAQRQRASHHYQLEEESSH